jgi:hypothetical protein
MTLNLLQYQLADVIARNKMQYWSIDLVGGRCCNMTACKKAGCIKPDALENVAH